MNRQEIFDYVANYLANTPGRASNRLGGCRYLNEEGLMCAAGCLMPAFMSAEEMRELDAAGIIGIEALIKKQPRKFPAWFKKEKKLILELQYAHDDQYNWTHERKGLEGGLKAIANFFDLNFSREKWRKELEAAGNA